MNLNILFPFIASIVIGGILAKQVSPSIVQQIRNNKIDTQVIQTEKYIFEAIQRYIALEKSNPTNIAQLISKGYFDSQNNTNGFGGSYDFSINGNLGKVTISTDITDANVRSAFINSHKNTFKPVQGAGNTVSTTFVIPTSIMHGNGQFMDNILIQDTAPAVATNKYWYDTSGTNVVLKMSNGTTWKAVQTTVSAPTSLGTSIVNNVSSLPTTGIINQGDIKYVYDSSSNSIQQYAYYNSSWTLASSGSSSKNIQLVSGTRYWSDNSYATSCLKYLNSNNPIYKYSGATGDGVYKIDPDGPGGVAPFDAYCDQTTDGGGWTLVFYSNSDNIPRTSIDNEDWGMSPNVNFSILWSMRNQKTNGKYEFYIYDSSTIKRNIIFTQTNAYYENPIGNSFTKKSGNLYYSFLTNGSTWFGLGLGNYGNTAFQASCSLAMASEGSSWTYCLQDQLTGQYGTGPWFYDTPLNPAGYDPGSQQWVKIFQR